MFKVAVRCYLISIHATILQAAGTQQMANFNLFLGLFLCTCTGWAFHIQCKFGVKTCLHKGHFTSEEVNTSAGRLEVFWLLADLSMEKHRTARCQIHNHGTRRDCMADKGSRSNKWPSSHPAPFCVYTSLLIRSIRLEIAILEKN